MSGVPRERITIDLRGLGPAIRAHAKSQHVTVAAAARRAVVTMLDGAPLHSDYRPGDEADAAANQTIKVTVRMRRCVARHLSSHANARGLSHGAYLSTLIEGAPALPLAADHREAVAALGVSTDQLALVAADLQDFARLVRHGMSPSVDQFGDAVAMLAGDVRIHLGLASRLMADLKPMAAPRRAAGKRLDGHGADP